MSTVNIKLYIYHMYVVNLYNIRWKKRYTQEEIIKSTGLSKKVVVRLFSGKYHNYELKTLETISEFFNCNICDILIKVD